MHQVAILGSTDVVGSTVCQAVVKQGSTIAALAAFDHLDLLQEQIFRYHPRYVTTLQPLNLPATCSWMKGTQGLLDMIALAHIDLFIIHADKLYVPALLQALRLGKTVAVLNSSLLLWAGDLILQAQQRPNQLIFLDYPLSILELKIEELVIAAPLESYSTEAFIHNTHSVVWDIIKAKFFSPIIELRIHAVPKIFIKMNHLYYEVMSKNIYEILEGLLNHNLSLPLQLVDDIPTHHVDTTLFPAIALAYQAVQKLGSCSSYFHAAYDVFIERIAYQEITASHMMNSLWHLLHEHHAEENQDLETIAWTQAKARQEATYL